MEEIRELDDEELEMVTGGVDFGSDEDDPSLYEVEDQPAVI